MENQEIKEANRKAMPMFILLVIAGAAAGGIMGFVYNSGFCSVNIKPLLYEN